LQPSSDLVRRPASLWSDVIFRERRGAFSPGTRLRIGVLPGEGVGPEVVSATLSVLSAIESCGFAAFEIETGGAIGREAELLSGRALTEEVARFCEDVFAGNGAILAGPGGGRFVYDLRRRFDLFCKISPLRPVDSSFPARRLKSSPGGEADILIVRENVGGEYQGEWSESTEEREGRVCEHTFRYTEREVRRILEVAAALASARRGRLAVAVKDSGIPGISALWREIGTEVASAAGVAVTFPDIDLAAYRLLQEPESFDVLAASNLFGDVLADLGAVLLGSRGLSFSGNFSEEGAAVYQTNHGSALDIAGQGRANPIGQIASLAMLLRESFGLVREAEWIGAGVREVLGEGYRTFDIAEEGCTLVGAEEMGRRIASAVERLGRLAPG
jgi:3-isopropylmalate dehydrogenase